MGLFDKKIKSSYGKIDAYKSKETLTDDLDMLDKMCKHYFYAYYHDDRYEIAYHIAYKGFHKDIEKKYSSFSRVLGNLYDKGLYVKKDRQKAIKYYKQDAFIRCNYDQIIEFSILSNWIYHKLQDLDDLLLALAHRIIYQKDEKAYLLYEFILNLKEVLHMHHIQYISYDALKQIKDNIYISTLLAHHCGYDQKIEKQAYLKYASSHHEYFACEMLVDEFNDLSYKNIMIDIQKDTKDKIKTFTMKQHLENINRINNLKPHPYKIFVLDQTNQFIDLLKHEQIEFYDHYNKDINYDSYILITNSYDVDDDSLLYLDYHDIKPLAMIAFMPYDSSLESSLRYAYCDYIDTYTPLFIIEPAYNQEDITNLINKLYLLQKENQ